jgi:hypothetical protein
MKVVYNIHSDVERYDMRSTVSVDLEEEVDLLGF